MNADAPWWRPEPEFPILQKVLCENQNLCYLWRVAGSNLRLAGRPAAKGREQEFFLFFSP
jgi:hypothetical protein